jgi:hypothetical protein
MAQSNPASDAAAVDTGGSSTGNTSAEPGQQGFSRLVIKSATVSLEVVNVRDAEAALRAKVAELGGYVVSVQTNGTDEALQSSMTFRVPAARFDDALNGVQGIAKQVLSRTITGDDVTEEFVDLESNKRTLEATRDRLLTFLEKAQTVEEALQVNTTLTDIQAQIDQIEGRKQYLSQSAALSTITVAMSPEPSIQPLITEEGWQPAAVAQDALRGLIGFGQGLATIAIVVLVWSPVWLPLLLLALWARRKMRGTPHGPSTAA